MSACKKKREDFRVHCVPHLAPPCICPSPNVQIEAESKRAVLFADTQALLGGAHIALTCLDLKQMHLAIALICVLFLLTVIAS